MRISKEPPDCALWKALSEMGEGSPLSSRPFARVCRNAMCRRRQLLRISGPGESPLGKSVDTGPAHLGDLCGHDESETPVSSTGPYGNGAYSISPEQLAAMGAGQQLGQQAMGHLANVQIAPTIQIRPGYHFPRAGNELPGFFR
jgi:hypothetical protein